MKVTSVGEALELEKNVSPEDCIRTGKHHSEKRILYRQTYGLTEKEMKGYIVHHICRQGDECLNPDHLVLMTDSDHKSLHHKGKKISVEQRSKISASRIGIQSNKGYKHTDEARANMSKAHMGYKHTDKARANISKAQKGKKVTAEQKAKTSLSLRIYYARKHGDMELVSQLQKERDALD